MQYEKKTAVSKSKASKGSPRQKVRASEAASFRSGFSTRLKRAAESHDLGDLASKIDVAPTTLYRWLNGKFDPSLPKLAELAEAMDVSLAFLVTGAGPMGRRQGIRHALLEGYDLVQFEPADPNAEKAPLAFYEPWLFKFLYGPAEEPTLFGPTDMKAPLLVEVRGDAMEPTFSPGDLLLVDRSFGTRPSELQSAQNEQRSPLDGVYVFRAGAGQGEADESTGHLIVRRVQYRLDGTMIIRCDNPRYPEEPYSAKDARPVPVGRVVWRGGRV